jgi:hypothetical protein
VKKLKIVVVLRILRQRSLLFSLRVVELLSQLATSFAGIPGMGSLLAQVCLYEVPVQRERKNNEAVAQGRK